MSCVVVDGNKQLYFTYAQRDGQYQRKERKKEKVDSLSYYRRSKEGV